MIVALRRTEGTVREGEGRCELYLRVLLWKSAPAQIYPRGGSPRKLPSTIEKCGASRRPRPAIILPHQRKFSKRVARKAETFDRCERPQLWPCRNRGMWMKRDGIPENRSRVGSRPPADSEVWETGTGGMRKLGGWNWVERTVSVHWHSDRESCPH